MPDPININPLDFEENVALGVGLPMNASTGAGLSSTYYTKDQIKANMTSLFSTRIGERVMQPLFGTKLWEYLFEPSNADLKSKKIFNEVKRAISVWIPYVTLKKIDFPVNRDEKRITVKIYYTIPNYDIEDTIDLEVN